MLRTHTLAAAVFFVGAALSYTSTDDTLSLDQGIDSLSIDTFLAHMIALSSDVMSGRQPGTAGYDSAAAYVAAESQALGLKPGGVSGTYL